MGRAIGQHDGGGNLLVVIAGLARDMPNAFYVALRVRQDRRGLAPEAHDAARLGDDLGELEAQLPRAAFDIGRARRDVRALRQRIINPPDALRIVPEVKEIGAERAFERLARAEGALEHLVERRIPVARRRLELPQRALELGERGAVAGLPNVPERIVDALHVVEEVADRMALVREAFGERIVGGVEARRQLERLADRAAAHPMHRARRQEFELVEHAELLEDAVLHVARMSRVGGLVKRSLDRQRADAINGGCAAEAEIALEQQDGVAGLRELRARGQSAQAGADHDGVEFLQSLHLRGLPRAQMTRNGDCRHSQILVRRKTSRQRAQRGSSILPSNSIAPDLRSTMKKRKGWST